MAATLYAVPASHPCACVERALQLKAIDYRRIDMPPVAHMPIQKARFGGATVPGLVLDGRKILGSLHIIRALEEKVAEPPLLPADPKERKSVQLAEGWGDEVLQPLVRRVIWSALGREPAAMPSYSEGSRLQVPAPLAQLSAPLIARAEQRINRSSDLNVRADLAHLAHHLDRIDNWIADGVLGGVEPNAADLQIGPSVALLASVEDLADILRDRPAPALARRWFPDYPEGSVPAGTLPPEWLRDEASSASWAPWAT